MADPLQHGGFVGQVEATLHEYLGSSDIYSSIFCGAIAGICAKTAIAPAERIKMSFQVNRDPFSYAHALSRGKEIVRTKGVLALWKGHSTSIIRVSPYAGLNYAVHDFSESSFKTYLSAEQLPYTYKFAAGAIAGGVSTLLTYPLDVLRVRLALGGSWNESITQGGLFQGLTPTLLGIIPYSGTTWMVKQQLNELYMSVYDRRPVLLESFVLNSAAGLTGQFITYPLDVVRRRMQVARGSPLKTFRQVLNELVETEGVRGLTKGYSLNIIKGPVTMSISLTTYDVLRHWLRDIEKGYQT